MSVIHELGLRNLKCLALGGVRKQVRNFKELTEGNHQKWSVRLNLTQRREPHQFQTMEGLTVALHDSLDSGAWPFLVGGAICLVYSVNERDLDFKWATPNEAKSCEQDKTLHTLGRRRLKQVCDAFWCLGQHVRYTENFIMLPWCCNAERTTVLYDRTSFLKFWTINEEFQVDQSHHLVSD